MGMAGVIESMDETSFCGCFRICVRAFNRKRKIVETRTAFKNIFVNVLEHRQVHESNELKRGTSVEGVPPNGAEGRKLREIQAGETYTIAERAVVNALE